MKIADTKLKKTFFLVLGFVLLAVVLIILFISPLTKYLVEKYDEKYTGRKITMDWAYVNPFTGYVHFSNLKIYELQSDSVFLSVAGLSAKFELLKIVRGNYEISQLTLNHPLGNIIQDTSEFNFSSFIKSLSPEHPDTSNAPGNFNILKIKIEEGEFHYFEKEIPVTYFIKGANIESEGKLWDADSVVFKFFFLSGPGSGSIQGKYVVNFKTLNYQYTVMVHDFDLTQADQYIKPFINYGTFRAKMDANLSASGNFSDQEDVTAKGLLIINDFHFGKNAKNDYVSFEKFALAIHEMNPKKHIYVYDSVLLVHPYFKYELYDKTDNIETMFGKKGAALSAAYEDQSRFNLVLEIARYVKVLAKNFFQSQYKIDKLEIHDGDLKFNDYSLFEKFTVDLNPFSIKTDSIDKNHKQVDVSVYSGIQPFGNVSVSLSINPSDTANFDLHYHVQKIPVSIFNPYLISYTSFPLDRGTVEVTGTWNVRKGNIQSDNHLLIIDPRVTKKMKNKETRWLPLPLIMSFIRESGNVIDYEIPITGNLKNPKFHLHDVLFDLLGNIFVKPATTPYRSKIKSIETEIEKALTLKWEIRQATLLASQEKFAGKAAGFLEKNPEATITVTPRMYDEKEKEYILFFEAKKKYYLFLHDKTAKEFSEDDSERVCNMSVKDSLFIGYLNNQVNDKLLFSIQEKCGKLISPSIVNAGYKQLNKDRETAFLFFFKEVGVEKRVKMNPAVNTIPYNGFSFYKINYKGEMPDDLREAFQQMNELNEEAPRKEFLSKRKKTKSIH